MLWLLACGSLEDSGLSPYETGTEAIWQTDGVQVCNGKDSGFVPNAFWGPESGVTTSSETGLGVSVADMNGDGLLDLVLPVQREGEIWYQLEDGWVSRSIYTDQSINVLVPIDLDGDGDLDLDAGGNNVGGWLENVGGGQFEPHLQDDDILTSLAWADVDQDGALDRIVGAFGRPQNTWFGTNQWEPGNPNRVELANGDALPLPDEVALGYTYVLAPLDANVDGAVDLYAVNDFGNQVLGNQLLFGPDLVEHRASYVGNGMGLAVGDINHDGYPDLAFSGWQNNALLIGDGTGGFIDSSVSTGMASLLDDQYVGWGTDFGDVDNDGDLDLLVGFGQLKQEFALQNPDLNPSDQPDVLLLNDGGVFVDAGEAWGLSGTSQTRGALLVDLNGDGFLDLVRKDLAGRGEVLMGQCTDKAWLVVEPRQPDHDNPLAVGARVEVLGPDTTWTAWTRTGGRSLSSSAPPTAHFGLGDLERVTVRVTWPDGAVSLREDIATRQRVIVTR